MKIKIPIKKIKTVIMEYREVDIKYPVSFGDFVGNDDGQFFHITMLTEKNVYHLEYSRIWHAPSELVFEEKPIYENSNVGVILNKYGFEKPIENWRAKTIFDMIEEEPEPIKWLVEFLLQSKNKKFKEWKGDKDG